MSTDNHNGERIAKVIARAGLCSRRDAEKWIAEGRVTLNGDVLDTPAVKVTKSDIIYVDKKPLPGAEPTRLFMHHKPAGLVTSNKDDRGRQTVFDAFPDELPRVVTVGRLDLNTEGLLLLTNDGGLSRFMELPSTGWVRRYRVRVHGHITDKSIQRLDKGMTVEGVRYSSIKVERDGTKEGSNQWLMVSLTEGKNREIRRVMEAVELRVNRLIRLSYGPFQLGNLPRGAIKEVPQSIMKSQLSKYFKDQKD
jgi:23S rRNA pseudouridine2605 synthase